MAQAIPLTITASDEYELRQMVRSHRMNAAQAQRARIILALAAGENTSGDQRRVGVQSHLCHGQPVRGTASPHAHTQDRGREF